MVGIVLALVLVGFLPASSGSDTPPQEIDGSDRADTAASWTDEQARDFQGLLGAGDGAGGNLDWAGQLDRFTVDGQQVLADPCVLAIVMGNKLTSYP